MNEVNCKKKADFFYPLNDNEKQRARFRGTISAIIFNARVDLNMNQTEFAKYMGVTRGTIRKWEGCDYNFTVDLLFVIFDKLHINFDIIINDLSFKKNINA